MIRNYIGILLLAFIVIGAIIYGFTSAGSPIAARNGQFDQIRSTALNEIHYQVESYYTKNNKLPVQLSDINSQTSLSYNNQSYVDPETQQPYTYQRSSDASYKLCAVFKTDTQKNTKGQTPQLPSYDQSIFTPTTTLHPAGEFCFNYSVQPVSSPTPMVVSGSDNQAPMSLQGQLVGTNTQKIRILSAKIIGQRCTVQTNDGLVGAGSTTFTTSAKDFCSKGAVIFFIDGQAADITTADGSHCLVYEPGKAVANLQVSLGGKQDTSCQ